MTAVANPPATVVPGGSFTAGDTTKNQGTIPAGASATQYYLCPGRYRSSGDILLTGSRSVGTLNAGASSSGSRSVIVPAATTPGTYYLLACADDLGQVSESNEGNNCSAAASEGPGPGRHPADGGRHRAERRREEIFIGTSYRIEWTASDNVALSSFDVAYRRTGARFQPGAGLPGVSGALRDCVWALPGPPPRWAASRSPRGTQRQLRVRRLGRQLLRRERGARDHGHRPEHRRELGRRIDPADTVDPQSWPERLREDRT